MLVIRVTGTVVDQERENKTRSSLIQGLIVALFAAKIGKYAPSWVWSGSFTFHMAFGPLFLVIVLVLCPLSCSDPPNDSTKYNVSTLPCQESPDASKNLLTQPPQKYFILIDTAENRLYVRDGNQVILEAICSTGSGHRLIAGGQEWTFETPRGQFQILAREKNPVWRKPDWAFLEQGEPIPQNEKNRIENGVLGNYALDLGHGYFIHGTLYTRLLGQNVTHGCIRLGEDDLASVVAMAPLGTQVFIY